ncbi:hypothetical protein [Chamaesiphon minutus]|uniref:Uncharacterized protein n=1 Tax=Chamaesiphon minutus (strain ATCC 27169 / PCC 6605) TaxID=1173020 RepID=K9UHY9_CHAP6|nr:hypothetical protein [Chamaesiphon minutus]AFY94727.1 hypothetical protein Cha6605_3756 [Chamaesiphon minutus PCC 6605]
MLKLTSVAIGLLTVIAIAPKSEAITANVSPVSISQPAANFHSQVILKIGDRHRGYSRGNMLQRRREQELQRERQARRRERARRRDERSYGEYRRDRLNYRY